MDTTQVILFDVGGVLLTRDPGTFECFDELNGLCPGTTRTEWRLYLKLAHVGLVASPRDYAQFPLLPQFIELHYRTNRLVPGVGPVLAHLAARHRLGVISNFTPDLDDVLQQIGVRHYFVHVVNSALEGLKKPDPSLYRIACAKFDVRPAETIFIDDSETNVSAAREFGMKAITFVSPTQLLEELRACAVEI